MYYYGSSELSFLIDFDLQDQSSTRTLVVGFRYVQERSGMHHALDRSLIKDDFEIGIFEASNQAF